MGRIRCLRFGIEAEDDGRAMELPLVECRRREGGRRLGKEEGGEEWRGCGAVGKEMTRVGEIRRLRVDRGREMREEVKKCFCQNLLLNFQRWSSSLDELWGNLWGNQEPTPHRKVARFRSR